MNRKYFQLLSTVLTTLVLGLAPLSALAQRSLEIPSGTSIRVRMIDNLSSEQTQRGDTFRGTLDEPIEVNGRTLYPKGADVIGRVTDVHPTGRLTEPGELDLVLNTVSSGTVAESIHVEPLIIKGESHSKSNVTKIGGGAALGAVIGAIAGGGKGAAIGAANHLHDARGQLRPVAYGRRSGWDCNRALGVRAACGLVVVFDDRRIMERIHLRSRETA